MNHLIVAFETEAACHRVCELLAASALPVRSVCKSGAEVIRAVRYMGGGVVVCGVKLPDMTADQLYDDLEGDAYILAAAKPEALDLCENPHIFRLPLPTNRYALAAAVQMLTQLEGMSASAHSRPDQEIIQKAKILLETNGSMTEEEAHRYLQKRSMQSRRKMAEVAADVVREQSP